MANIIANQKNGKVVLIDTGSNSSIALSALRVDDSVVQLQRKLVHRSRKQHRAPALQHRSLELR